MWARFPESEIVSVVCVVAWDWGVVSLSKHDLSSLPGASLLTISTLSLDHISKEANWVNDVSPLDLPGVALLKPEVWNLDLLPIFDELLENSIIVPNSVAPRRQFKGGHRVKEAGSKSTKASVAEASIGLLLVDVL